jgi:hypothetical protein
MRTYSVNSILSPTGAVDDQLNKHKRRKGAGGAEIETDEINEKPVVSTPVEQNRIYS